MQKNEKNKLIYKGNKMRSATRDVISIMLSYDTYTLNLEKDNKDKHWRETYCKLKRVYNVNKQLCYYYICVDVSGN